MMRSVTQPKSFCHGIQCGTPRMSMVAMTGSPMTPVSTRFLGQNALDDAAVTRRLDPAQLSFGRHGDVEHFDRLVLEQGRGRFADFGDAMSSRRFLRARPRATGNGHRIETGFAIGHEMAIVNYESRTQNADAKVSSRGQR